MENVIKYMMVKVSEINTLGSLHTLRTDSEDINAIMLLNAAMHHFLL